MPNGKEYFDVFDGCALERGPNGKIRTVRMDLYANHFALPAVLHGCAAARAQVAQTTRDVATAPPEIRKEVRDTVAFVEKSCAQRGTWAWQGDRFVKK